jgi:hypothetical protein
LEETPLTCLGLLRNVQCYIILDGMKMKQKNVESRNSSQLLYPNKKNIGISNILLPRTQKWLLLIIYYNRTISCIFRLYRNSVI